MSVAIRYVKGIFRYKLTAVFFVIGQLVMFFAIFGALGIYNKAYEKENDRLEAIYKERIEINATTVNQSDIFTDAGCNVSDGNLLLAGKLSLDVAEAGVNTRTEVLLAINEELPYKMLDGYIPGTKNTDKGKKLVALGRDKYQYAYEENGKHWITIGGEVYEVCGIIGSEVSDYWDYKIVMSIECMGKETLKTIISNRSYTLELSSNENALQEAYKSVYSNIMSLDPTAVVSGKIVNSMGASTMESTLARENIRVNVIVYIFCILNCMVMSKFWIIQRRKELAIRKTFGMSNFRIIMEIVQNIVSLIVIALLIFVGIYVVIRLAGGQFATMLSFNITMCLVVVVAIIITTAVTMIYPIYRIIQFNPVESMSAID
ncbi:MAG: ABC transporter permease [Lachnospira sp.]|nr:ABC transporter permease [Lachnospira sp.]